MRIPLSDHFSYGKLLKFTLSSVAMMIFTSIYGVVDGYFVSNFAGTTPFAAVNLIMPFLMIVATVGFMFGTGGTALVAMALGEGKRDRANRLFSLFVYTALTLGVAFAVLGIVFIRPIAQALGATGALLDNCVLYARVILLALPFFVLQLLFQSFYPTAEKPTMGFKVTLISGVTNMILDAVLVLCLPQEHKLLGAAIATAVSQMLGGVIPLVYFSRENDSLLRLDGMKFDGRAIGKACVNGSSEFMSNVSMSAVAMLYNKQLMQYAGENGIAAYGVMMYVSMIFAASFIGYSIGTSPIFGFHYGAGHPEELKSLLKKSLTLIGGCGVGMVVLAQLLARVLASIFVGYDATLMELTVSGFRVFALSFLFMGFAIFGSGLFTALGDGLTSALISFLRTLVFQSAAVLLLPRWFDIEGVWWSIVVAESMAFVLFALFLFLKRKKYRYM